MDVFAGTLLDKPAWMWAAFFAIVATLLAFDLGVLNRHDREISVRRSLALSGFYITIGLLFGVFVWAQLGNQQAQDYYTGFLIEKTLSLDNIFVISLVFSYFAIPRRYQYRVLFWGVLGMVFLRAALIGIGAGMVHHFDWTLYIFAAFLMFTGAKMLLTCEKETDIGDNPALKFIRRHLRVTPTLIGRRFFVRDAESAAIQLQLYVTPLFIALVVVECVDLIFAIDSVPAIFAVTTDEYIVYTSNVFAILGLRALYFTLGAMLNRFEYLHYSLAAVLMFIGGKVFYPLLSGGEKISSALSLAVTLAILGVGIGYSLYRTSHKPL